MNSAGQFAIGEEDVDEDDTEDEVNEEVEEGDEIELFEVALVEVS